MSPSTNYRRRSFFRVSIGAAIGSTLPSLSYGQNSISDEQHSSGDGGPLETLRFSVFKTGLTPEQIAHEAETAPVEPSLKHIPGRELALKLATISLEYAKQGISRSTTPRQVEQFLAILGFPLRYPDTNDFVPFCAAGMLFAACRSYYELSQIAYSSERPSVPFRRLFPLFRENYFLPHAAVHKIRSHAIKMKRWSDRTVEPKRGWPVVFSWTGDGKPSHVGIVTAANAKDIQTVEFNTTLVQRTKLISGLVAEKSRARNSTILGYVRLYE